MKAVNSLVLFAIIGQDEIFQRNLYNRKDRGKKTIHKAKKQLPNKELKMDTKKDSELVNYSNT